MELHENTTDAFIAYLKRHGYPEMSIATEWGTKQCMVDIAILADDGKTPVAIYEIKGKKSEKTLEQGIRQLTRVRNMLALSVPMSLVFGLECEPYFEVLDVSDIIYNAKVVDYDYLLTENNLLQQPISYKNIQLGVSEKKLLQKQEEHIKRIDKLKPLCWVIVPLLAIGLLLADATGKYVLTAERLIVFGTVLLVVLLPFFSEVTIKDFSFKRKSNKE